MRLRKLIKDHGDRIRRQVVFGETIIHFVLPRRNLLINVFPESLELDNDRSQRLMNWLQSRGFNYLEFTEHEVSSHPRKVIRAIESCNESDEAYALYLVSRRALRDDTPIEGRDGCSTATDADDEED
jgi:very-short-patch-repair endonuclease